MDLMDLWYWVRGKKRYSDLTLNDIRMSMEEAETEIPPAPDQDGKQAERGKGE